MARGAGIYSRLVAISKLVLPVLAMGLLALVFLVEREDNFDSRGITFAKAELEELASGLSLRNPQLSGPASGGGQYFLTARDVRPTGAGLSELAATDVTGRLEQASGQVYHVSAQRGTMDRNTDQIALLGDVEIRTNGDVQARAQSLQIDLAQDMISSEDRVVLRAPGRSAEADRLHISPPDTDGNRMISLRGAVKVRFTPGVERDE
ncbi:MAG: LPS export ABC transporter periplasmic protein LptC [Pseudomonadota bacterium]